MKILYAILLVLSAALLYGTALLVTAIAGKWYRRVCPACGLRGLKCVNFIRATVLVEGKRAPDHWAYYVCEKCGAAFKLHHGAWGPVPEEERQYLRFKK